MKKTFLEIINYLKKFISTWSFLQLYKSCIYSILFCHTWTEFSMKSWLGGFSYIFSNHHCIYNNLHETWTNCIVCNICVYIYFLHIYHYLHKNTPVSEAFGQNSINLISLGRSILVYSLFIAKYGADNLTRLSTHAQGLPPSDSKMLLRLFLVK